ncbi:MAG: hypothetical protein ACXWQR_23700, partial [Ktedonobacterales bacterium]
MVALPSLSPHTPRTQPSQPIDLLHRAPIESAGNPLLAHDTAPSQTTHPASPSSEPQPPAQSEQHQQPSDDEAAEGAAAYSPLLKDHVFALYCAGQRSPAIAAQLGIPERTARHWIHTILQQLAEDDVTASPEVARQQRALAIESQRAASASAWTTYHRLTAAHNQLLDRALMSTMRQDAPQADAEAAAREQQRLFTSASRLASAAARYLSLVISANREIAHLQGHAITQDARERQATAARDAADARQLEADLIRAFTTPLLPPEPVTRHASPSASWPGGITTPQSGLPANTQPHPLPVSQSEKAVTAAKTATPVVSPLPSLVKGQEERSTSLAASQTKIAAKTATPFAATQPAPQFESAAKTA